MLFSFSRRHQRRKRRSYGPAQQYTVRARVPACGQPTPITAYSAAAVDVKADPEHLGRCASFEYSKLALLPLIAGFSIPLIFFITYGIAVDNQHVTPVFPFISDTGASPPESCVFGQLLNMASVLVALTIYVKYRQLLAVAGDVDRKVTPHFWRANTAALCLGLTAAFGMTLVANFQKIPATVFFVHMVGAFLVFIVGTAYGWLHCWLTHRAPPPLRSARLLIARTLVMSVTSLSLALTLAGMTLAKELRFTDYAFVPDSFALLASSAEWIMSFGLAAMFLTFAADFRRLQAA